MKEKLIYEAKYPRFDYMKEYERAKAEIIEDPHKEKLTLDEILKGIYADTRYIPIPKRTDTGEDFIREAIDVSKLYEIDARITQSEYKISVSLSFDFGGDMQYISRLFGMADRISFFKDKSEHDFAACLDLYTHVVVRKGLAVAP